MSPRMIHVPGLEQLEREKVVRPLVLKGVCGCGCEDSMAYCLLEATWICVIWAEVPGASPGQHIYTAIAINANNTLCCGKALSACLTVPYTWGKNPPLDDALMHRYKGSKG
jgi:hypothetical protein